MARKNSERYPARQLRLAVDRLPIHTKEAMLEGIARNRIIVGAYVDPSSGGICPMLAAHRNGGRTSVATFARAWDAYTDARGPRRATRREVTTLRSLLEASLAREGEIDSLPVAELARQIRAERERLSCDVPSAHEHEDAGEPEAGEPEFRVLRKPRRGFGTRTNFGWLGAERPRRSKDLLAAAEEQLSLSGFTQSD